MRTAMAISPRLVGLVAALALIPVVLYGSGRQILATPELIITAINVVLITASLFLLFGPSPGGSHGNGAPQ